MSAYRKGYSCQSLFLDLIYQWRTALDNKFCIGSVFMDLSKCFDCMPHALLISKLDDHWLTRKAYPLFSDYLCNRVQRTKIGVCRSPWAGIIKGVPQGCGLGPMLFNVFINHLFYSLLECKLYKYADDNTQSKVGSAVKDVFESLRIDAWNATKWFTSNFMKVNPENFQVYVFRSHDADRPIS